MHGPAQLKELTERELEIVYLLVNSDEERYGLANSLGITEATPRRYSTKIYSKLETSSPLELINRLRRCFSSQLRRRKTALVVDIAENWLLIVQCYLAAFNLEVMAVSATLATR